MHADTFQNLARQMVFHRDQLVVNQVEKLNSETNIGVQCALEDYALLIGKAARNIRALKTIFDHIGRHHGVRLFISVLQTPDKFEGRRRTVPLASHWDQDEAMARILSGLLDQAGYNSTVEPESAGNKTVLKIFPSRPIPADLQEATRIVMACIGRMRGRIIETDV